MGINPSSSITNSPTQGEALSSWDTAEVAKADTLIDFPPATRPPALDLDTLIDLSNSRSCQEAVALIVDALFEYMKAAGQQPIPFNKHGGPSLNVVRPQQFGNVLYIPGGPEKLYVMSDLEGDFGAVEALFRRNELLPAMAEGKAQCIFLGDTVDRSGKQASQILEFLLDLKLKRGFHDTIHLLAGNHELSPHIQADPRQGGFFQEVVYERPSYSNLGNFDSDLVRRTLDWHREEFPGEDFGSQHQLRVALWRLYNNLFRGLPKVVLTGNGAVLCHAGPTDTGPFAYIGDPKVASSPPSFQEAVAWLAGAQFIDPTLHDDNIEEAQLLLESHLTWSDCTLDHSRIQQNLKRRSGLLVGPDALQSFLDILGRQVLIRGHQKNPPPGATRLDRHAWTAGHQVITINSVLENGDFIETDSQSMQLRSRQHLELDLSRQIRSVDDISLKKL